MRTREPARVIDSANEELPCTYRHGRLALVLLEELHEGGDGVLLEHGARRVGVAFDEAVDRLHGRQLQVLVLDARHGDDVLRDAAVDEQRLVRLVNVHQLGDGPDEGQQQGLLAADRREIMHKRTGFLQYPKELWTVAAPVAKEWVLSEPSL